MVVVDNARRLIGKTIDVVVTSVLQTTAGKMIFGRHVEAAAPGAGTAAAPTAGTASAASEPMGNGERDEARRPRQPPAEAVASARVKRD